MSPAPSVSTNNLESANAGPLEVMIASKFCFEPKQQRERKIESPVQCLVIMNKRGFK